MGHRGREDRGHVATLPFLQAFMPNSCPTPGDKDPVTSGHAVLTSLYGSTQAGGGYMGRKWEGLGEKSRGCPGSAAGCSRDLLLQLSRAPPTMAGSTRPPSGSAYRTWEIEGCLSTRVNFCPGLERVRAQHPARIAQHSAPRLHGPPAHPGSLAGESGSGQPQGELEALRACLQEPQNPGLSTWQWPRASLTAKHRSV